MNLYFECKSGISGDMAVAALLDLGADKEKLDKALSSINLENEFEYKITKKSVNGIMTTDFDVILKNQHRHEGEHTCGHHHEHHHHEHRNLNDINKIIDGADAAGSAKTLAKKIFEIVAKAESKVHGKPINEIHFHEVGAIDSIADILSFAVLFDDLNPKNVYISPLTDGQGFVTCQHGKIPVPVPAVVEIASSCKIPLKFSSNEGEMVTPTGAAIAAALYNGENLPEEIIIEKIGLGAGKRPYEHPILRVFAIKE